MRVLAWVRASQAVLFEASVVPACVGTAAAVAAGSRFVPQTFLLILISLLGIQAGANLLKGYYEAEDRAVLPSSTGSWIRFDSGAAVGLATDPRKVLRVASALMIVGVAAGLLLVALTRNLLLLAFGLAGFVLAWTYSSPPLKLSYRGVGELSTFFAFGPIMTVGATIAFDPGGWSGSLLASLILGFLAASISFSRYFPNAVEDRAKGKRTPVTIFGRRTAAAILLGLLLAPIGIALLLWTSQAHFVWALLFVPFAGGATISLSRSLAKDRFYSETIGMTVLSHVAAGLGLVLSFLL